MSALENILRISSQPVILTVRDPEHAKQVLEQVQCIQCDGARLVSKLVGNQLTVQVEITGADFQKLYADFLQTLSTPSFPEQSENALKVA